MPTFTMTKNWDDGLSLTESMLDDIKTSVETFLNTTKLDADNLQDSCISTVKIAANAVTTAKILDANVTTSKILDANVTRAKLEAVGQQVSGASASFSQSPNASYQDVTNCTVTITTTGRPVFLGLVSDGTDTGFAANSSVGVSGNDFSSRAAFKLLRGATVLATYNFAAEAGGGTSTVMWLPPGCIWHFDVPAAGTYTYKLTANADGTGDAIIARNVKLVAWEL